MINLCAPALIYVSFSLTQIIIDTFKGLYNTAFFKFIVMIIITILLNALCQSGMGIISWIIVFIPFILMSVIVAILLYVFGLDPATGTLKFKCDDSNKINIKGGNLIYSITTSNPNTQTKPKFIDVTYSETPLNPSIENDTNPVMYSTDPQFN